MNIDTLANRIHQLILRLDEFKQQALKDGRLGYSAWVADRLPNDAINHESIMRRLAIEHISDLFYHDDQDPRVTQRSIGLLPASEETLSLAQEINALKFSIKNHYQLLIVKKKALSPAKAEWVAALKDLGIERLHIKQVSRQICLLDERPERIGFSVGNARGYEETLTIAQAQERLASFGEEQGHIRYQLNKLIELKCDPDQACFQVVRERQWERISANIKQQDGTWFSRKVAMPILYPASADLPLPAISLNRRPGDPLPDHLKADRCDKRYSGDPFLPSLHAFLIA